VAAWGLDHIEATLALRWALPREAPLLGVVGAAFKARLKAQR
jgi:hypothetical protein